MALSLLRKNSDSGSVGIDIDGRYLAAAQASGGRLTRTVSAELPEGVLKDGEVIDRAALSAALKEFTTKNGLPRHVRLGVSNQQIVVRVVDLPRIDNENERASALRFQAAETIAMPLDEAVLDHQVAAYVEEGGAERMRVVLVAARRTMIEEFLAAAKDAGLKLDGIDLDAFALVRTLADDSSEADTARVYCHLGGVTNLAVAVGSSCFFTRALSTTVDDEGAAAKLADEIRLSIDYYRTQPGACDVAGVVVSGPGARDEQLLIDLGAQLGIPVQSAEPLGALDATVVGSEDEAHRYTVAAGLAMGASA
jgi:type IV pilus assembly protein PilM